MVSAEKLAVVDIAVAVVDTVVAVAVDIGAAVAGNHSVEIEPMEMEQQSVPA